jgi:membrane-associated phospholipid phosphatase
MVYFGHRQKTKFYHLTEAVLRFGLLLLFTELETWKPFTRKIQPEEVWLYRNPMTDSYVPGSLLWTLVTLVPLSAILAGFLVYRDKADLTAASLVVTLAMPLNGVLTDIIKLCVGRPRPDFVYRCWPGGVVPPDAWQQEELTCAGEEAVIVEGRKSFPSGHSSFSFASWGFVFLYLSGKLGTFHCVRPCPAWRLLLPLLFLLAPLVIALSRTADYHHHWQDVLAGSGLGLATVWVVYRQHYPALTSPSSGRPLGSRAPDTTDSRIQV